MTRASDVVDARGERCPLPVIRLARLVAADATPRRVVLLATDPAADHDVPAWCRMRGHRLVETRPEDGHTAYVVQVLGRGEDTGGEVTPSAPATAP